MRPHENTHLFNHMEYAKSSAEIKEKAEAKIKTVTAKMSERERRIAKLREEYEIDDAAFIELLKAARRSTGAERHSYMSNKLLDSGERQQEERTIGAGVVNNLLSESDFIEAERADVRRLNLLVRNLRPVTRYAEATGAPYSVDTFQLSTEALEYLGF